jgi:hypothetical protein
MDPQQQVMQQQFTDPIPPYQFRQTSHNMMPLEQTTINRTPSTSNNKNNIQDEPEVRTNYTWQQVKKRKRSNQSPEIALEGNCWRYSRYIASTPTTHRKQPILLERVYRTIA